MDTLVSLGVMAACGWSVYAMSVLDRGRGGLSGLANLLHGSGGGIYLEVAASVTTFLLAGRLYEARARRTAGQAIRNLAAAGARDVCVLGEDGAERRVPAALLQAGQRFVVRPGERIAADGVVLSGKSAVDRSMMTGESVPADAAAGDPVIGGTIALTGRLVVRADKVGADTQLAHLIAMIEQAQAGIQRLAGWDGVVRGGFAVTDAVKPSAAPAVARLRALGLRPVLLTGDNAATAQAVGACAGIGEVLSEALPAAKARVVAELQGEGRSVAMVGDGVNDGPALAAARLGLAVGSGTDVAICAVAMILLRDDLDVVPDAIALARATFRTIRTNLAWAFCYNVLAIPLAALGFLNPLLAAVAMTLSSIFVVWNSLRLRRFAVPRPSGRSLALRCGPAASLFPLAPRFAHQRDDLDFSGVDSGSGVAFVDHSAQNPPQC